MSIPIRVTDSTFEQEVINCKIPVLVDFWASWCPPCKMLEPVIDTLAHEYDGKVKFVKFNVDQNPQRRVKFQISGVPTFILFKGTKEIERRIGSQSKEQLNQMIGQAL